MSGSSILAQCSSQKWNSKDLTQEALTDRIIPLYIMDLMIRKFKN